MKNQNTFSRACLALLAAISLAACGGGSEDSSDTDAGTTGQETATGETAETTAESTTGETGSESDSDTEGGPGPRGADSPPALGAQIDRAGRAAVSTATIATFHPDTDIKNAAKDDYNAAPFAQWQSFAPEMVTNLAILDSLDATCGNQLLADAGATRYAFLAAVLADDRLWLNSTSGQCGTYLGVEAETIGAVEPGVGGCGGRSPTDDVIERSYSVLAAGVLSGIDDGVTEDDGAMPDVFPFMGEP